MVQSEKIYFYLVQYIINDKNKVLFSPYRVLTFFLFVATYWCKNEWKKKTGLPLQHHHTLVSVSIHSVRDKMTRAL